MPNIRLSVCIATLNRAGYIGATLDSIIAQATDEVEIVIVDGASVDETADVIHRFQKTFSRLQYERLPAKGGVDQDYNRAVELAKGEYCWLMSDDDILKSGAIQTILKAIHLSHYSLIIVNTEMRDAQLQTVLSERQLRIYSNKVYPPDKHTDLFVETANHLSYIGGVVIQREIWQERDTARYFGSAFIHIGVIFQRPLPRSALAISKPLIVVRSANASWSSKYFEIWMFKWPNLVWSFTHYPDAAKQRVFAKEPWHRLGALLICRAKGAYSLPDYEQWLEPRLNSPWRRRLSRGVAQIPGSLVNFLAICYFRLFRPSARADLLDFQISSVYFRKKLGAIGHLIPKFIG